MRIAKVGLGIAGRMRLFFNKENTANLVGNATEELLVATTSTLVAEFAVAVEITGIFLHEILQ
jgi:hypothetical protein